MRYRGFSISHCLRVVPQLTTLIAGSKTSTHSAVRKPIENSPIVHYSSPEITCNINISNAIETVAISVGSSVGFELGESKAIYHLGPVAIYLGKAPNKVVKWDGTGQHWFKIAEWGTIFSPFNFKALGMRKFAATIPADVPSGEYLVMIEHIALHVPGSPEFFVGCAQIKVTGGGSGNPIMLSIPGHLSAKSDPGLTADIYWPIPTEYKASQVPWSIAEARMHEDLSKIIVYM